MGPAADPGLGGRGRPGFTTKVWVWGMRWGRPAPAGRRIISLDPKSPVEMKELSIQSSVGMHLFLPAAILCPPPIARTQTPAEPRSFCGKPDLGSLLFSLEKIYGI